VAARLPRIKFYAFTKTLSMFDFSTLTKLPNVNILPSYVGGHLNYGTAQHVIHLAIRHGAKICPATAKQGGQKCNINCKWCQEKGHTYVAFFQH